MTHDNLGPNGIGRARTVAALSAVGAVAAVLGFAAVPKSSLLPWILALIGTTISVVTVLLALFTLLLRPARRRPLKLESEMSEEVAKRSAMLWILVRVAASLATLSVALYVLTLCISLVS
ncbi:hypothetical protein ACIBH1_40790 [Nonomuraea sp. NPDC050663]|uniref:hypothetical protein n=1 Tax=Nonomuraea sp. NPDC050663 TaxID=3364370 RepID=UPI00378C0FC5